jgi:O-antigen ligase
MLPSAAVFPQRGPLVVFVIMMVVAVRLQEFVPFISVIKPVFVVAIFGMGYLLSTSPESARVAMMGERQTRVVLSYFGWALLTIPFALWPGAAFGATKSLFPAILMFLAFMLVAPTRRILDRLQTGFVVLVLLYAMYAKFFGGGGRLSAGGMYDSNDMGSLMAMSFPLAVGLLIRAAPGRARLAAALGALLTVLTCIASGSRGGTLGLVAGALVFALGQRGARGFFAVLGLIGGLALAWTTAPADFQTRMLSIRNLESDYNYTEETGRKAVWRRARGYIREHPIMGVGAGNFPVAEGATWADMGRGGKWSATHNAYLQAASELGLVGGVIYVLILLTAARQGYSLWGSTRRSRGPPSALYRPEFLASLAAFSAAAYFLSHAYFPPLFALVGLVALADRVRRVEDTGVKPIATRQTVRADVRGQRGGLALGAFVRPHGPPRLAP